MPRPLENRATVDARKCEHCRGVQRRSDFNPSTVRGACHEWYDLETKNKLRWNAKNEGEAVPLATNVVGGVVHGDVIIVRGLGLRGSEYTTHHLSTFGAPNWGLAPQMTNPQWASRDEKVAALATLTKAPPKRTL